ncbi:MAG TPA: sugar phosphate isomerase/epimerase family protein [Gammaproteobacteria bacterium]|nr:sugar phosphate isomerase/epimerase family protein [Gammaproteobacteria bacterium]
MISKFITAYAQQHYYWAERGIIQASEDGANYWYIDGSLPGEYPEKWSIQRIASLNKMIRQYNVKPIFHGNFKLPLAADVLQVRERAVRSVFDEVDLCSELSAPLILHGGVIVEPRLVIKAKKDALDNYLRSIEFIVEYAREKNVTVLLENLSNYKNYRPFHYIFTTPEEYKYVLDRIGDEHVHLFFDVGHGAICDGDPALVIQEFHKRIWGMSFSNNDGIRDLHLGINRGVVDYQKIIDTIVNVAWKGVIAFEVRGRSFSQSVDDVSQLFERSTVGKGVALT